MTSHAQANTLDLKGDAQMPKGYWIVGVDVKNEEPVKRYVAGNQPIFEKFSGHCLVRAQKFAVPERLLPISTCCD